MGEAPAADGLVINLSDVEKTFKGKVRALRGIDLRVHRGEIFGLLGPNGAGKSTLVKILMTIVRPTKCKGEMLGAPVGDKSALRRVGYLPEHLRFPNYLTGAQALDFYAAMSGVERRVRKKRAGELLDVVGMSNWAEKKIRGYSKGMKQRMGIAQALMADPDLVFLDEPTDGVDPVGRRDIRQILVRLRDEGKTVFLNSHLLSELEMVCGRVAILVQGLVAQQGTIEDLTSGQAAYEVEVVESEGWESKARGVIGKRFGDEKEMGLEGRVIRIGTTEARAVQPVIDAVRAEGLMIRAIRPVRPTLEDLFMQAVTDPHTGEVLQPGADRSAERTKGRGR
ncbi:MAG: ABC transporter ATP-binding protein, partial [Planctomycetota bacterium]|nr:ABC transporter ATP-binding protein [Planctomycetota bacterium]